MFLVLALAGTLIGSTQGQFDNMDDEDFSKFLGVHEEFGNKYGESAVKGCITGGIGGAIGGISGMAAGCGLGAAGNVAQDAIFGKSQTQQDFERAQNFEKNRNH